METHSIADAPIGTPGTGTSARDDVLAIWRAARDDAERAYRNWCGAAAPERRLFYAVYLAAADRESAAATALVAAVRSC